MLFEKSKENSKIRTWYHKSFLSTPRVSEGGREWAGRRGVGRGMRSGTSSDRLESGQNPVSHILSPWTVTPVPCAQMDRSGYIAIQQQMIPIHSVDYDLTLAIPFQQPRITIR